MIHTVIIQVCLNIYKGKKLLKLTFEGMVGYTHLDLIGRL